MRRYLNGYHEGMDVASELVAARRAAGLSQRELARLAGTSQSTLCGYESGRKQPSAATFARLLGSCGARLSVTPATEPAHPPLRGDRARPERS